jgi:hypothetical protein
VTVGVRCVVAALGVLARLAVLVLVARVLLAPATMGDRRLARRDGRL